MYILLFTLLVQCYIPFIWKVTDIKKYDSRVILMLNYIVTVTISAVIAHNQQLFSVFRLLPEGSLSMIMQEKTLANTAWIIVVMGTVSGVVYYLSLYYSQRNISVNGMGISSFFSQAGLVGSLIIAFWFFDEEISAFQGIATVGIVLSILLMTSDREKIKIRSPLLLVTVCLFNVAVGVSNKFYAKYAMESYKTVFLTIAFFVAFLTAGIKILWDIRGRKAKIKIGIPELFCGITLGAANLLYSYLNLKCLEVLPAVIVVPTLSAGGIIVSSLIAILLFKETTSRKHMGAILFSCICIFILNL